METPTPSTGARRTTARPLRDWGMPVASPRRGNRRRRLPRAALEQTGEANASGHARVLVVEDDPDTRRALLMALAEDLGEPIAPAADGEEALWVAAEAPPDVV